MTPLYPFNSIMVHLTTQLPKYPSPNRASQSKIQLKIQPLRLYQPNSTSKHHSPLDKSSILPINPFHKS